MSVLIVGEETGANSLRADLETAGMAAEVRADEPPPADGPDEIGQIAGGLREFERILGDGGPDAVLVASASPAALAAVLVATKAGTPVARLDAAGPAGDPSANARLIGQLADTTLAAEPAAISDWARDGYPAR